MTNSLVKILVVCIIAELDAVYLSGHIQVLEYRDELLRHCQENAPLIWLCDRITLIECYYISLI